MGAFFLHRKQAAVNLDAMQQVMQRKGFDAPQKFSFDQYDFYLYSKILVRQTDHIERNQAGMYVCGSICYKALSYSESLEALFTDHENNRLDTSLLQGVFCIIFIRNNQIEILTDQSGIQNIFYTANGDLISSSFLAITEAFPGKLSLNRLSITEALTTGLQIGPDTTFNEISRYEFIVAPAIEGIKWLNKPNDTRDVTFFKGSYKDAVASQVDVLKQYIKNLGRMADEFGVDSGITGGHDSRLLLAASKDVLNRLAFHSHWRKVMDQELACAKLVCEEAGFPITVHEIKHPFDMTEQEAADTYAKGMLCYDGLVRMHCYFYEPYNAFQYRTEVLKENRIGLNGIGGEQYRNDEHMFLPSWNTRNWIKYQLIRYETGTAFKDASFEDNLDDYMHHKISQKLFFNGKTKISKLDLKRYQNEVFVPARMGARNNAENQLAFFFSPYSDAVVSQEAYKIVPYLGISFDFEEDMIEHISPEIAGVMSDYGFDFINGEPLKRKAHHLIKELMPFSYKSNVIDKRFRERNLPASRNMRNKFRIHREAFDMVASLDIPLDLERLAINPDLMGITLSMGYLLNTYHHKINF